MSAPVIAIVTDAIAPYHRGGKEQRYDELAPRLALYADVHVYTMKWWRGHRATRRRSGVAYHAICPFMPLYRGERRSIAQALMFALASLKLSVARFDVLEADHMPYLQLFSLKLVVLLRRKRMVVTWHEVWDRAQWSRYLGRAGVIAWWLEQLAMRLPDCIIAASPQTAEKLIERIGDRVPVVVAPNGIDLDLVIRTPPAHDPADVVTVGRLLRHKRFDMVLDAIASLAQDGKPTTSRIIGDGPERRALNAQATRLGIGHLVEFRHEVPTSAELLSLLKASRMFAFPSEREGFGIAALEAIACGLPVIATTAPHNLAQHLVQRSARGVLREHDPRALADAIEAATSPSADGSPEVDHDWLAQYDWTTITARIAHALTADGASMSIVPTDGVNPDAGLTPSPPAEPQRDSALAPSPPAQSPPQVQSVNGQPARAAPSARPTGRARALDLAVSLAAVAATRPAGGSTRRGLRPAARGPGPTIQELLSDGRQADLRACRLRARVRAAARRAGVEQQLVVAYEQVLRALEPATARRNRRDDERARLLSAAVLSPDSNCVDIGASEGRLLAMFAELAPRGRHIAYEPVPHVRASLARRFPQADVRGAALSDHNGESTFVVHKRLPSRSSLRPVGYDAAGTETIRVRSKSSTTAFPPRTCRICSSLTWKAPSISCSRSRSGP